MIDGGGGDVVVVVVPNGLASGWQMVSGGGRTPSMR
jgi:hypothetical protein